MYSGELDEKNVLRVWRILLDLCSWIANDLYASVFVVVQNSIARLEPNNHNTGDTHRRIVTRVHPFKAVLILTLIGLAFFVSDVLLSAQRQSGLIITVPLSATH